MPKNYYITSLTCRSCQQNFHFHTYNAQQWKYYYNQEGQIRPSSDFYQLYCQPPFPNYQENVYLHCRRCLVFFHHTATTDQIGQQKDGAIYIDQSGLCWECRQGVEHVDHPCLFNQQQRAWGSKRSWEGLFATSDLLPKVFNEITKKSKN